VLNRRREIAEQIAARRRREDEAPRLQAEVPSLASLSLSIEERRATITVGPPHIRRVVVERAPALFVVQCCAQSCDGGAHELTWSVLAALRRGERRFDGETRCDRCDCVVQYSGEATYR
jgi:hypothetical protein